MRNQVGSWLWKVDIQEKDLGVFSKSVFEAMDKMQWSLKVSKAKSQKQKWETTRERRT